MNSNGKESVDIFAHITKKMLEKCPIITALGINLQNKKDAVTQ